MKFSTIALVLGIIAVAGSASASIRTINLNNYASSVDLTPDSTQATMTITDIPGGVKVGIVLDAASYFASTGHHVTVAWNLDTPQLGVFGLPTNLTFSTVNGLISPPGCKINCGSFTNGIQGNWNGTNNHYAGPLDFNILGVSSTDFVNNSSGFAAAVDVLGSNGTGEVAGYLHSIPEESTWAMLIIGFISLKLASTADKKRRGRYI